MATLLKGGVLVELEPATVERGDLRIEGNRIVGRGLGLPEAPGDDIVELDGKLVFPGLVSTHHRLYPVLRRGLDGGAGSHGHDDPLAQLEGGRWKLESALDGDAVQASAAAGALEALCAGTTTLLCRHASPGVISGSLTRVARGLNDVGLRAGLGYELTDRSGALAREEALEESGNFVRKARGRFRGLLAAHASFSLGNDALDGLSKLQAATGGMLHLDVAEDPLDERASFQRFGEVPVTRLAQYGLLGPKTVAGHAVHLSWPDLAQVIASGSWIAHVPRMNMHSQSGYAPAGKFGARASLGTDAQTPDLFLEAKLAALRARDAGQPIHILRYLANGHRIASQLFDTAIGPLRENALADLLVVDYRPFTPLHAETLSSQVLDALSARHVESVMVDGIWRLWARRPLSVDAAAVADAARTASLAVGSRMSQTA